MDQAILQTRSDVLRHELNDRAAQFSVEAKAILAKAKHMAMMMRTAAVKVVVTIRRCVSVVRRVRSVRRPAAKKVSSSSSSSDGPAAHPNAHDQLGLSQQHRKQFPQSSSVRAFLAQIVLQILRGAI